MQGYCPYCNTQMEVVEADEYNSKNGYDYEFPEHASGPDENGRINGRINNDAICINSGSAVIPERLRDE